MVEPLLGTPDLCDQFREEIQVADPIFKSFGGVQRLSGEIQTLKIQQDNQGFWESVRSPGQGRILVVDAGGDVFAVMGDKMGLLAVENGWKGVLINGYIRDSAILKTMPIGVWALGVYPMKGTLNASCQHHVSLAFAGVLIEETHYLYADEDGLIFSQGKLPDIEFR